jgi:hypothetical protein
MSRGMQPELFRQPSLVTAGRFQNEVVERNNRFHRFRSEPDMDPTTYGQQIGVTFRPGTLTKSLPAGTKVLSRPQRNRMLRASALTPSCDYRQKRTGVTGPPSNR